MVKDCKGSFIWKNLSLTLYVQTPQNGQTHSNSSSATAEELFEFVWPFCGWRLKG